MDQGRRRIPVASGSRTGDRQIQSRPEGVFPDGCLMWIADGLHGLFHVVSGEITFRADLMDWVYVLHVLGFVVIFAFFFVHLYLGTIGNPGSVSAMISGKMELPVLKMLHPKWVKEMEHEGNSDC